MMELLPSKEEVLKILRETGALREGHFILPTAIHTNFYFQMPLAFRYFDNVRRLCVGLSRLLRVCGPVAMALPDCTVNRPCLRGYPGRVRCTRSARRLSNHLGGAKGWRALLSA